MRCLTRLQHDHQSVLTMVGKKPWLLELRAVCLVWAVVQVYPELRYSCSIKTSDMQCSKDYVMKPRIEGILTRTEQ